MATRFVEQPQLEAALEHKAARASECRDGTSAALCRRVVRLVVMLSASVRGQLVHALRFLALPTRFEPGCLGCRVSVEENDEPVVRYEEEWATEEALRLHVRSERFTRFLEVLEAAPEPPDVKFDFVTKTRGLDYVAEVRKKDGC